MSFVRELYQETIVDHGRHPRHFGVLPGASHQQEGFNPLCGDKIILYVLEKNGVVEDIRFEGSGCAISVASASLMTENVKGKSVAEVETLFHLFHEWIMHDASSLAEDAKLGKLAALGGVREFPMRIKCATLAWHTLKAILSGEKKPVSTE